MRRPRAPVLVLAALALALAGCVQDEARPPPQGTVVPGAIPAIGVVAVVDTGIDPYHEAFRGSPETDKLAAALFPDAVPIQLSSGAFEDAYAKDEALWKSIQPGVLYRFVGTRVLGINMNTTVQPKVFDFQGHGTSTAGVALRDNPAGFVVSIQVSLACESCSTTSPGCGDLCLDLSVARAMAWASSQPSVDVISMSMGLPGNPPESNRIDPVRDAFLKASREAASHGQLITTSAGNEGGTTLAAFTTGPPWIICAGGFEIANKGDYGYESRGVDVVANVSEKVPNWRTDRDLVWKTGTSFAAPHVAGTLAAASEVLKAALPTQSKAERAHALREALNATTRLMGPTDFDPTGVPRDDPIQGRPNAAPVPTFPGPFGSGWGYLDGSLAPKLAQAALTHASLPSEKSDVASLQAQWQAQREQYWSAFADQ